MFWFCFVVAVGTVVPFFNQSRKKRAEEEEKEEEEGKGSGKGMHAHIHTHTARSLAKSSASCLSSRGSLFFSHIALVSLLASITYTHKEEEEERGARSRRRGWLLAAPKKHAKNKNTHTYTHSTINSSSTLRTTLLYSQYIHKGLYPQWVRHPKEGRREEEEGGGRS